MEFCKKVSITFLEESLQCHCIFVTVAGFSLQFSTK